MSFQLQSFYLDNPINTGRVYDVFMPDEIQHETAIFLIHGGAWRAGSRTGYHSPIMETFANQGYIVASTDYRLTATAAEQLQDCREAYMHFVNQLRKLNRPFKVAVQGSSAGAHLASLLSVALPGEAGDQCPAEMGWLPPECVILQACPKSFTPWDEIFPHVWAAMQDAAGVPFEKDPEVYRKLSFDQYVRPGMPRIFFMEAEFEHMFWTRMNIEFAKEIAAKQNRVLVKIYQNMEHGFLFNFDRAHQREAFADFIKFIENEKIENCVFEA